MSHSDDPYNYYSKSEITVLVPVKLVVYSSIGMIIDFTAPDEGDIEQAYRDRTHEKFNRMQEIIGALANASLDEFEALKTEARKIK